MTEQITPIAIARTPFKQKFGIPRQSGLIPIKGVVELLSPFNKLEAIKGIESCSHLWLIFQFSSNASGSSLSVRPPRLGGNEKLGVFSTRSSFRPNGIGMSLVRLLSVDHTPEVKLIVSGVDLLDQTPIIDIKPYLPYADVADSPVVNQIAPEAPKPVLKVEWQDSATEDLVSQLKYSDYSQEELMAWMTQLIAYDPRPAYKPNQDTKPYAIAFDQFDVHFRVNEGVAVIEKLLLLD